MIAFSGDPVARICVDCPEPPLFLVSYPKQGYSISDLACSEHAVWRGGVTKGARLGPIPTDLEIDNDEAAVLAA